MPKLLVRNGDAHNPRIGIDWRAVAAIVAVMLGVGTVAIGLLTERVTVLAHVARGDAMMTPVQNHLDNIGPYKHLDLDQFREFVALTWQIQEIRRDVVAIKRHLRIKDDTIRLGADYVRPGDDN